MADRSRPGIRVSVLDGAGQVASRAADLRGRVMAFAYQDGDKKADTVTLTLDNRDLALFETGDDILGGTMLEVSWGYPGAFSPPRTMVVKKISGGETLSVEALALSAQMNMVTKSRQFRGMSRAQVVAQIAAEYGYAGALLDVEETVEQFEVITQNAETDAVFVTRLAARERFVFYVDDTGFHWHKRRLSLAPTHTFTWRGGDLGTIQSWSVESNLVRRIGKVTVQSRDPLTKTNLSASATNGNTDRATLGDVREVVDPETLASTLERDLATDVTRASAAASQGRAAREAAARFEEAERETVELKMRVIGDATIRAKTIVNVSGLTVMFDGLYYVREATHTIDGGGFYCDLKLIRDAKGKLARQTAQAQAGSRNDQTAAEPIVTYEVVDPETLGSRIEYRRRDAVVGTEDPEARMSR